MFNAGSPPESLGKGRDWNVDLVPKLLMADGLLFLFNTPKYYFLVQFLFSLFRPPRETTHIYWRDPLSRI